MLTSLGFEMLDRHVVHGRGEDIAFSDATGSMTFAKLTERAGELAGGLRMFGVQQGDDVEINLPAGRNLVTAVCAVIRLGAVPGRAGAVRITEVDGEARVQSDGHDLELVLVQKAGRSEPAPSLQRDADGYGEAVHCALGDGTFRDIVETLLSGSPVV